MEMIKSRKDLEMCLTNAKRDLYGHIKFTGVMATITGICIEAIRYDVANHIQEPNVWTIVSFPGVVFSGLCTVGGLINVGTKNRIIQDTKLDLISLERKDAKGESSAK